MLLKSEAQRQICRVFQQWCHRRDISNATVNDGLTFFLQLEDRQSYLLEFRGKGDKWQDVKGWLLRAGLVVDN